jgi:hypothetical protein
MLESEESFQGLGYAALGAEQARSLPTWDANVPRAGSGATFSRGRPIGADVSELEETKGSHLNY